MPHWTCSVWVGLDIDRFYLFELKWKYTQICNVQLKNSHSCSYTPSAVRWGEWRQSVVLRWNAHLPTSCFFSLHSCKPRTCRVGAEEAHCVCREQATVPGQPAGVAGAMNNAISQPSAFPPQPGPIMRHSWSYFIGVIDWVIFQPNFQTEMLCL